MATAWRIAAERRAQAGVSGGRTRTRDGDAAETVPLLDVEHVLDDVVGLEDDGVADEACEGLSSRRQCADGPFSNSLTWRTMRACIAAGMLWWMTPMPPSKAMAIAVSVSVTVSIGDETSGRLSTVFRVSRVCRLTSEAGKSMWPGCGRSGRPAACRIRARERGSHCLPVISAFTTRAETHRSGRRACRCP